MKKAFIHMFLLVFLIFTSSVSAESKASYVFRWGQPKQYIMEETKNILDNYEFSIIRYDSAKGYIQTGWHLVNRRIHADFMLIYIIQITEHPYGTRMNVTATVRMKDPEYQESTKRNEVKSAWWIIKALVKRIGR